MAAALDQFIVVISGYDILMGSKKLWIHPVFQRRPSGLTNNESRKKQRKLLIVRGMFFVISMNLLHRKLFISTMNLP